MFDIKEFDLNVFERVDEVMAQLQVSCIQDEVWLFPFFVKCRLSYKRHTRIRK